MARRRSARAGAPWLNRLFWLGVLGFTLWFSVPRIAAPIMASNGYRRVEALREPILAAALEFDLDPHFLAGIALAESSGRVDVVSRAGALGLFQLMLPTAREQARELGLPEPSRSDLLSRADLSARLAARYVRWLSDRYADDGEMVLVAYNAGPGRLDGWIAEHGSYDAWRERRASDSEVLGYARKVRRYSDEFVERGLFAPRARDAQPMEAARAQRP